MTDLPGTKRESDEHRTRYVHVAIYEHPHGDDVRVFRDEAHAWNWRTRIAKEWWSHAFDGEPPSEDVIGSEYFDRMADKDGAEYFSVVPCELETGDSDLDGEGSAS